MSIREHIKLMEIYQIVAEGILLEFDTESFLNKVRGIVALMNKGATQTEKEAAYQAMKRLEVRAAEEMTKMSGAELKKFEDGFAIAKSGGGGSGNMSREDIARWRRNAQEKEAAATAEREAREKAARDLRAKREAEQAEKDNAAKANSRTYDDELNDIDDDDEEPNAPGPRWKNITLYYFGRLQDAANNHDKVYGLFFDSKQNEYFTCWGEYQGKLSTKMIDSLWEGEKIFMTKRNKGYKQIITTAALAAYVWNHLP